MIGLLPALAIGLALVPRIDDRQPILVPVETLPEPAVATTAALLPAESQATLASATFDVIPINQLGSMSNLVGPVILDGRIWLIASVDEPDHRAAVFSSGDDGITWSETGEIVTGSGTMMLHDLESFGGSLVALGTTMSRAGPAAAYGYPDQVIIWRSSDGSHWNEHVIIPSDGRSWHPLLNLVTDGRTMLIAGRETGAGGNLLEETIPKELLPAVQEGQLDVIIDSAMRGWVSVVAPPGIEVFRSENAVSLPDDVRSILYRSEDLGQWEEVGVEPTLILSGLVVKPGGGFVVPSSSGDMYSAIDGLGWGRNLTIPPATYSRWEEWLVGLQSQGGVDRLVIGAGTDYATIGLPLDTTLIWSTQGEVTGGPAGLVSLVPIYLGPTPTLSITSGSQDFTLRDGMFSISTERSSEASVVFHQLPGSYDPASGTVSIDLGDGGEQVVIDLDQLQGLRESSGGEWETHVYASLDALRWSKSDITFATADVEVLGALPNGFLLALGSGMGSDRAIELYRTGPLPLGVNG